MKETFKPYQHQEDSSEWLLKGNGGCLSHSVGTGKTLTALLYFTKLRKDNPKIKMLVVAPLALFESAWVSDIKDHTNYSVTYMRKKDYNPNADIQLINYESIWRVSSQRNMQRLMTSNDVTLVLDEAGKVRDPRSNVTRYLMKNVWKFKSVVAMSGTLAPNSEVEYWSACHMTKPGILPDNYWRYRNMFFVLARGKQHVQGNIGSNIASQMIRQGFKYVPNPTMMDTLQKKLSQCLHIVHKEDCLDLPDIVDTLHVVEMNTKEKKAYKDMFEQCMVFIDDDTVTASTALTRLMKCRQMTSGFIYDEDHKAIDLGNTKVNAVKEILNENSGEQAIVWTCFRHQAQRLLKAIPDSISAIGGNDTNKAIDSFIKGDARVLVASPQAIGHGVDGMQKVCSLMIFESLNYSYDLWEQCRGRLHRNKQEKKVTTVSILAKNSIDVAVYNAVKNKAGKQELLNMIKGL